MAKKNTGKKGNVSNKRISNSKKFPKKRNNYGLIILIIILSLLIILSFINNIYLRKIIKIMQVNLQLQETKKRDKIIFLGDSIVEGYDLQKYYSDKNIINQGVSGDTTQKVLDRLQKSVFDYNTKKVILLIGTNDIQQQIDPSDNIELIIHKIKNYDKKIEIAIESIYPVNQSNNSKINKNQVSNRTNEKIKEINKKIESICKKNNVKYINIYNQLTDKDGNLKLEYTKEGLHITEQGYKKITNLLSQYVNEK